MAGQAASFSSDDNSQGGAQASSGEGAAATQQTNQNGDQAFLIVGDRAFTSREAVVNKIANADTHIQKIEGENGEMRRTLAQLQEEVERLRLATEGMKSQQSGTHSGNEGTDNPLSKEELVQTVVGVVRTVQNEDVRSNNINSCFADAAAVYGDEVKVKVKDIADSLGMPMEAVDEMAKSQPRAFRQLFIPQGESKKTSAQPAQGDVNTAALQKQNQQQQPGQIWSAKGKNSKDIAAEVARRLAAFKDE